MSGAMRRVSRRMIGATGIGGVLVALLISLAPLAAAGYVSTSWAGVTAAAAAGPTLGSGVNTPTPGQPTAILSAGIVDATFGFTSTSGLAFGHANYHQEAYAFATPPFVAWKGPTTSYTVTVYFGFSLAANAVQASVNCAGGGTANATAVIIVQDAVYDVTTATFVATLGPAGGAAAWTPFTVSCAGGGIFSVGNPAMSLPTLGSLTGPTPLYLVPGNTYEIEGLIAAYGGAYTTIPPATATAAVNFGPGGFVEIAYTTVT